VAIAAVYAHWFGAIVAHLGTLGVRCSIGNEHEVTLTSHNRCFPIAQTAAPILLASLEYL
jgi:hypothetical protein